jgi:hypothetical protein
MIRSGLSNECHYSDCHCVECHYAECDYVECLYTECRYADCPCAECHYAEYCYAEYHYAERHYAERHYAECHYAECRGANEAAKERDSLDNGTKFYQLLSFLILWADTIKHFTAVISSLFLFVTVSHFHLSLFVTKDLSRIKWNYY